MSVKPEKPEESECCGSGCNPCIFDVYEEQLRRWQMKQFESQNTIALSQSKFLPFLVKSIDVFAAHIKILEFQAATPKVQNKNKATVSDCQSGAADYEMLTDNLHLKAGQYLILKGQHVTASDCGSEVQNISRSYTPVLNDSTKTGAFKVIVALHPEGQMSRFIDGLKVQDVVFWRGPFREFEYVVNSFKRLVLVGGGTGIVPLYNIAKEIVENEVDDTFVRVLASFRDMESFVLRKELHRLQDYWNFAIQVYITNQEAGKEHSMRYNEKILFSKIDKDVISTELSNYEKDKCMVVICGPPSFNKHIHEVVLGCGVFKDNIFVFE